MGGPKLYAVGLVPASEANGVLYSGTPGTITGLVGAAHLNGYTGKILDHDASCGRYTFLTDSGDNVALKPENLLVDPSDITNTKRARAFAPLELKACLGAVVKKADGSEETEEERKERSMKQYEAVKETKELIESEEYVAWEENDLELAKEMQLLEEMCKLKPAILEYQSENWDGKGIALWCLRGRKYNMEKALKSFDIYIQHREEYNLDKIDDPNKRTPEEKYILQEASKAAYCDCNCIDKHGRLIVWTFQKECKPRETPPYYGLRMMFQAIEKAVRDPVIGVRVQRQGIVQVVDMDGYIPSFYKNTNVDARSNKVISQAFIGKIPLRMGGIFFIKAPLLLRTLWYTIVQWFMPKTLRERMNFIGSGEDANKILHEKFGKENVLEKYGGDVKMDYNNKFLKDLVS